MIKLNGIIDNLYKVLMSKYDPLYDFLMQRKEQMVILNFAEIEKIINSKLPDTAYKKHNGGETNKQKIITRNVITGLMQDLKLRTVWNMRDAGAILTIIPDDSKESKGTQVGLDAGEDYGKPMLTVSGNPDEIQEIINWIDQLPEGTEICIGGPRASECSKAYEIARKLLTEVITCLRS